MHCLAPSASHREAEQPLTEKPSQKCALLYSIGISLFCMRHEAIGTALQVPASFPNQPVYKYQLMEEVRREQPNVNVMPFAGSGLQEGHPLAVTGCRHKGVKPRGSRSLCTSASSARPVQGEGNSLAVTSQGTCQGAVLMLNSTVKRPLLEAHLFTEREREQRA